MKLYGKNSVIERLKSNPRSVKKIYIQESHPDQGYVQKKARKWGIPVLVVPKSKIQKVARNANAQGIVADIEGIVYLTLAELLALCQKKRLVPVCLDELHDPQNLGSIMRSLACLGGFALVLPAHKSVSVTEAALRVACGGENFVPVAKVANLAQTVVRLKEEGFWIVGAVVQDGENLMTSQLPSPLALVIGSEQKGIRSVMRKHIDASLSIPMAQPRLSMNAAQATTLFCYEIVRQRNGRGVEPPGKFGTSCPNHSETACGEYDARE